MAGGLSILQLHGWLASWLADWDVVCLLLLCWHVAHVVVVEGAPKTGPAVTHMSAASEQAKLPNADAQ
jgi:hypothetical protein